MFIKETIFENIHYTLVDDNDLNVVYTEASVATPFSNPPVIDTLEAFYPNKKILYFHSFGTIIRKNRHKGYGRKMLQYVKNQYKGVILYLCVCSLGPMSNEQLIDFYKSEGFKTIDIKYRYWPVMAIEL